MIVVDTSVWVAARRRADVRERLNQLIDADEVGLALPVRLELLSGVQKQDRRAFGRGFGALMQMWPTDETWQRIPGWIERAADAGQHFAMTDLLVASLAADVNGLVWSLDTDFTRMESVGIVSLFSA